MSRFYVLWITRSGLKAWSGPYLDRADAESTTAMRDRTSGAFIVEDKS